jgi:hypothetical protein
VSGLVRARRRVEKGREELNYALSVLELETESFQARQISLVELNLHEIAPAEARAKVVVGLGLDNQTVANSTSALGPETCNSGLVCPVQPRPQPHGNRLLGR